jgi:uncharacterized protein
VEHDGVDAGSGDAVKEISKTQARRIALDAQGFYDPLPARSTRTALRRVLSRVNLFQIDSVNVLVRSHYLPLFSRIGPYDVDLLERAAWGSRGSRLLFEYWAHEASLVPLELRPLFAWRMERARRGLGMWPNMADIWKKRAFVKSIFERIERNGAAAASAFPDARGKGAWWGWSDAKVALEYLFFAGELTVSTRSGGFERVYDLPERVFSERVRSAPVPEPDEAFRRLVLLAARALGIATEADLRDYFRLDLQDARAALRELVDAGMLVQSTVEGWRNPAYLVPETRVPRGEPKRSALLSPFDSLVWNRERTLRLFDFHYRLEIYTPQHKRVHGYYVLPFLHQGRLVGRVDLKADRQAGRLRVLSEHYETTADKREARPALEAQLDALAAWLQTAR